ncbi:hypothetical protein HanPI659440_Chr01g0025081 [Helianthus annuus]|nr:hypothetical protein HanPI659440_Chr01g0025081 [Helianthus annuus]
MRFSQLSESTRLTRSTQLTSRREDWNIVECTLASHVLETTLRKSYIASFAQEYSENLLLVTASFWEIAFKSKKQVEYGTSY